MIELAKFMVAPLIIVAVLVLLDEMKYWRKK